MKWYRWKWWRLAWSLNGESRVSSGGWKWRRIAGHLMIRTGRTCKGGRCSAVSVKIRGEPGRLLEEAEAVGRIRRQIIARREEASWMDKVTQSLPEPDRWPSNFLVVCQWGHSRSVAMAKALHKRGQPAVAVGADSSGSALERLAEWADVIILMEPKYATAVPYRLRFKCQVCHMGPDKWCNPMDTELIRKCEWWIDETFHYLKRRMDGDGNEVAPIARRKLGT